ncbi:hypothetical protein LSTR_LSTR007067 [Laodelphax striatellus]|uniref:HTH OST-type domain-containing protein n=1 Tax=Laodelphax striatellus TaxID=195883 RepID=A0A482WJH6_LAOST|nr:hypothetical protein LSTR_LSTR007067 [Laodelphax striatellus]
MIRACILSCKGGIQINALDRDYRALVGGPIPYRWLGYSSLEQFVDDTPDLYLTRGARGEVMVNAQLAESSVNRQPSTSRGMARSRSPPPNWDSSEWSSKPRYRSARSPPSPRFSAKPRYPSSRSPSPQYSAKPRYRSARSPSPSFSAKPRYRSSRSPPPRVSAKPRYHSARSPSPRFSAKPRYHSARPPSPRFSSKPRYPSSRSPPMRYGAKPRYSSSRSPPPSYGAPARMTTPPLSSQSRNNVNAKTPLSTTVGVEDWYENRVVVDRNDREESRNGGKYELPLRFERTEANMRKGTRFASTKPDHGEDEERVREEYMQTRNDEKTQSINGGNGPKFEENDINSRRKTNTEEEPKTPVFTRKPSFSIKSPEVEKIQDRNHTSYPDAKTNPQGTQELAARKAYTKQSNVSAMDVSTDLPSIFSQITEKIKRVREEYMQNRNDERTQRSNREKPGPKFEENGINSRRKTNTAEKPVTPVFTRKPLFSTEAPKFEKIHDQYYVSYPDETDNPQDAQELAAREAYTELMENDLSPLSAMAVTTDLSLINSRVTEIVNEYTNELSNGLWAKDVVDLYIAEFGETLPESWLTLVAGCDTLTITTTIDGIVVLQAATRAQHLPRNHF